MQTTATIDGFRVDRLNECALNNVSVTFSVAKIIPSQLGGPFGVIFHADLSVIHVYNNNGEFIVKVSSVLLRSCASIKNVHILFTDDVQLLICSLENGKIELFDFLHHALPSRVLDAFNEPLIALSFSLRHAVAVTGTGKLQKLEDFKNPCIVLIVKRLPVLNEMLPSVLDCVSENITAAALMVNWPMQKIFLKSN